MTQAPIPGHPGGQLWLELPPLSERAPRRLLVFLHGAGSRPEAFAPVAVAWQLKFPGATVAILQGLHESAGGHGHDWYDGRGIATERLERVDRAALTVGERVALLQAGTGIGPERTVLIGFSQGATVALQVVRNRPGLCAIAVAYAGRLAAPIRPGERIGADIHLVHGELDSIVPVVHARQALRGLSAAGARVTLDIDAEGSHTIDQEGVILGTTRVLQTIFRGRRPPGNERPRRLH
ncbi:MAG: dienelactone hydrolase family protein [Burkholderiales bacterium]|nr:dienelactone hydrolase family protein [Burkholderiales bacterium]